MLLAEGLMTAGIAILPIAAGAQERFGDGAMGAVVGAMSPIGSVSRVSPVHTAMRNCTRDEGGPFELGNQVLISSHCRLLSSKAIVVSVAEMAGQDPVRQG
jgi:hypothetical protein